MHEQILDSLRNGDAAAALTAAQAAIDADPQDFHALELLAAAQRLTGDSAGALANIDNAIALRPDEAHLQLIRAGLLLGARELDAAQATLARGIVLDPNLFAAYVMQAHLALSRGDDAETARLVRLASRIAPREPELLALEGMLRVRSDDAAGAQQLLANALQQHPDDPHLRYALGFTYMAQGHLAFAEQAFRGVLPLMSDQRALRGLIADLVHQQGRPGEAAEEIKPLLDDPATATPGLRRVAGELELSAGQPERALPLLREALAAQPDDRRTLDAIMETWRRLDAAQDARSALDALLATHPQINHLWLARLALEVVGGEAADALIVRWQAAQPDAVPPLEARMALQAMRDDSAGSQATAQRILQLEPGRSSAELHLVDTLLRHDPAAAITRIEALLPKVPTSDGQRVLRERLAFAHDRAGEPQAAVAQWLALQQATVAQRLPLPPLSAPRNHWPEQAPAPAGKPPLALLWGAPGSGVERLAGLLAANLPAFRADRFGPQPPPDALQSYKTPPALEDGSLVPEVVVDSWRAALPARGIQDEHVIDWLLWWDNSLLAPLRTQLPQAQLLVALRDPRDMLLDWLAWASSPFAFGAPLAAAGWLAAMLHQVATLDEQSLYPHQLLRLDAAVNDPAQLAELLGHAINSQLTQVPQRLPRAAFPAGHWRQYAQALAEPFALLAPVAQRLGYAD